MYYVYRSDRLDRESPYLLRRLVLAGIFSTLTSVVLEEIGIGILDRAVSSRSALYPILEFFLIVAFAEEGSKFFFMYRTTWRSAEFNCQFDGVVYATFISLGFALWENIKYVLRYGFSTSLIRAVTAIPGHACFGVFMGVWYGLSKRFDRRGNRAASLVCRGMALLMPALLHGTYDYIATTERAPYAWAFVCFVVCLFLVSFLLVRYASRHDRYLSSYGR